MITERDKGFDIYWGDIFKDVVTASYVGSDAVMSACWDVVKTECPEYIELEWELLFIPMIGNAFEVRAGRVSCKTERPVPTGIYVQQRAFGLD